MLKKKYFRPLEYVLHGYMLLLLNNAFIQLWGRMQTGTRGDLAEGNPLIRALLLAGYVLCLLFLLYNPQEAIKSSVRSVWLWALIGTALLSVIWSQAPDLTFRRATAVLLTTSYALVLVHRFSPQEFLRLFGVTLVFMLAASLAMVFLAPDWGIMSDIHDGDWRGIFVHKNSLGRISALAILTLSCLLPASRGRWRWLWAIGLLIAFITLLGSRSAAPLVITPLVAIVAGVAIFITPLCSKTNFLAFLLLSALALAGLWTLTYIYTDILALLGRNTELTGRLPLWQAGLEVGLQRPWTGWGYGAFWLDWQGPSAQVWGMIRWEPAHAHNGYLDLFLQLGLLGLLFGLAMLIKIGVDLLKAFWSGKAAPVPVFMLGLWIFMLAYNMNESIFLSQNSMPWVLLTWLALKSESQNNSEQRSL